MAVEEITCYDDKETHKKNLPSSNINEDERLSDWENAPLCVPQDSLEDIDWFPNFTSEIISLDGFLGTWDNESILIDPRAIGFTVKKQRSKCGGKRGPFNVKGPIDNCVEFQVFDNITERRKCSHCHVENTPQWRMGPLGPKSLCNACGVRYKSGRLVPEYRPAASPTFDVTKHSNSHKKILQRRNFSG